MYYYSKYTYYNVLYHDGFIDLFISLLIKKHKVTTSFHY